MDRQSFDEQIIDYLYDELSPEERAAFQKDFQAVPEFADESRELHRVGRICREHLPDLAVPPALVRQVLAKVQKPKRRFAWLHFGAGSFWRPALTGAFAMALTLGLLYQYKQHRENPPQVAKTAPVTAPTEVATRPGGVEFKMPDSLTAAPQPRAFATPAWRQPRFGNGLISFASYGNANPMEDSASDDIYGMDQQARNAVASFAHQQAMRMHAMGDHRGAAEVLAKLIQQYPNYPRLFEAAALRIGCLFQIGAISQANQELSWLRQNSPELAQLVEQRWHR